MVWMVFLCSLWLHGENYREIKTEAWKATSINEAMQKLYGTTKSFHDNRIRIKIPKIASNGGAVPIKIITTIPAKSIAILQDTQPYALVAVYAIHDSSIMDYFAKIKLSKSGLVVVVVEGLDGKLYSLQQRIEVALGGCDGSSDSSYHTSVRRTPPVYTTEEYSFINENRFKEVKASPLSTFGVDVDTASYANVHRYLFENRELPQKGAVRIEEMVNYFNYDYTEPTSKPFAIHSRVGQSLWNYDTKVLQIALQTKKVAIETLPPSNLVFLLDVSGSMYDKKKLPLLVNSLSLLVRQLREEDSISIVVYAGSSGLVLDRARGNEKEKILGVLERLEAGGSTAGGQGIELAYRIAEKSFVKGGNNRVILATDGDFNVGQSSQSTLVELIEAKRKSGIFLTVLGFGTGNYKDNKMEALANHGNGNYAYIDSLLEAKKVLVTELGSTLHTVAKDVKIQVEFNPQEVQSYRLIGYENRMLNSEDFRNEKVDAGEIGMGHSVTALYEIVPANRKNSSSVDKLKYQKLSTIESSEFATVKVSYKKPDSNQSIYMSRAIFEEKNTILQDDFDFAQAIVGFGMLLRQSVFAKELTYQQVISTAKNAKNQDREGYRAESIKMMEQAELLSVSK
jgi:Ca-activated chloride channel family protein